MIYVVNTDIEIDADSPETAEDIVLNIIENSNEENIFVSINEVKELD